MERGRILLLILVVLLGGSCLVAAQGTTVENLLNAVTDGATAAVKGPIQGSTGGKETATDVTPLADRVSRDTTDQSDDETTAAVSPSLEDTQAPTVKEKISDVTKDGPQGLTTAEVVQDTVTEEQAVSTVTTAAPTQPPPPVITPRAPAAPASTLFPRYRITTILEAPYMFLKPQHHSEKLTGNDRFSGMFKDMLETLSQMTGPKGFYYDIHVVGDGTYGSWDADKSEWTGLIGQLVNKEADIALAPLTMTDEREAAIDFTYPLKTVGPVIVMPKHTQKSSTNERLFRLVTPLHGAVWALVFVAFLVVSTTLYIFGRLSPYEWRALYDQAMAGSREAKSFNFYNSFWFGFSTLTWQGFELSPRSVSSRMVVAFWWVFVVITLVTYTAAITRELMFPHHEALSASSIYSAEDLLDNNEVTFGTVNEGATMNFFKSSKLSLYRQMWDRMERFEQDAFPKTTKEGIRKVRKDGGKYAFIMESSMAQYAVSERPCDLTIVGEPMAERRYAFGVQKNNPSLRDNLSNAIVRMKNNGEIVQLEKRWFSGECDSDGNRGRRPVAGHEPMEPLTVEDFAAPLILLLIGLVLSFIVFLVEFVVHKRREKGTRRVPGTSTHGQDNLGATLDDTV